jgi:hypothetical protein
MLDRQNHAAGRANDSIMVGMFVCLCLASKKPSKREFFVPAGTDLGVKLLNKIVCFVLCVTSFPWGGLGNLRFLQVKYYLFNAC